MSQFMLEHPRRGPGRGEVSITDTEALYVGCIVLFHTLFLSLEDQVLLDPDNPKDLFCLHFVFLSRLNQAF